MALTVAMNILLLPLAEPAHKVIRGGNAVERRPQKPNAFALATVCAHQPADYFLNLSRNIVQESNGLPCTHFTVWQTNDVDATAAGGESLHGEPTFRGESRTRVGAN